MSYYEVEVTVLGGLEVTIGFTLDKAEPDVGIFQAYVRDWHIVAVKGKAIKCNSKFAQSLYDRITKSGEYLKLEERFIDYVY